MPRPHQHISTGGSRFRPAANQGENAALYELENQALDPDGLILAAMRARAPWRGRTLVDLGCGSGYWLTRYAGEARLGPGVPVRRSCPPTITYQISIRRVSPLRRPIVLTSQVPVSGITSRPMAQRIRTGRSGTPMSRRPLALVPPDARQLTSV